MTGIPNPSNVNDKEAWLNHATEEKQNTFIVNQEILISLNESLRTLISTLQIPRNADPSNNADQVVVINTIAATVSSIATLTTLSNFNGEQAHLMSVASEINAWSNTSRSNII